MRAVLIGKITVKKLLSNNLQTLLEILLCQILHGKIKDKTPFPTVIDVDSIQVGSISQQTKTQAQWITGAQTT